MKLYLTPLSRAALLLLGLLSPNTILAQDVQPTGGVVTIQVGLEYSHNSIRVRFRSHASELTESLARTVASQLKEVWRFSSARPTGNRPSLIFEIVKKPDLSVELNMSFHDGGLASEHPFSEVWFEPGELIERGRLPAMEKSVEELIALAETITSQKRFEIVGILKSVAINARVEWASHGDLQFATLTLPGPAAAALSESVFQISYAGPMDNLREVSVLAKGRGGRWNSSRQLMAEVLEIDGWGHSVEALERCPVDQVACLEPAVAFLEEYQSPRFGMEMLDLGVR